MSTIDASCVSRSSSMNDWTSSFERGSSPVVGSSRRRSDARQQGSRDGDLLLHAPDHLLDGPAEALLRDAQAAEDRHGLPLGILGVSDGPSVM